MAMDAALILGIGHPIALAELVQRHESWLPRYMGNP